MGMMTRMRSLAPWFMFLVGGIFVLFMVLSDSRVTEYFRSQKQNIGSVDGEDISYQEYSSFVDKARKNQEQSTGQTIDESQMDYFRDQVWEALVTQKLVDKKIKEFGITVSDEEVRNTLLGSNPPQQLKQNFTDSLGNFNRQAYESALRDPRNKQIVIALEDQIREQLTQQKLQDYVGGSVTVGDDEARDNFMKQSIKMKAHFVSIDLNSIPENDVKVSDDEMKKYFDDHQDEFKVQAQRKLKFVLFRRLASQADSQMIKKNLESIVTKLKSDTASFKSYVGIYSEQPFKQDTLTLNSLPAVLQSRFIDAQPGEILGPVDTYEGYVVYKVIGKIKSKNELVRASHILVRSTGNDKADQQKANDIYNEIMKGADFVAVAKTKSDDGSSVKGGDLGWFGKGQMVKEFENACFSGKIGVLQKPVKTQFGYHIIKVTGKSNTDIVFQKIVNKIQISATTQDKLYQNAQDFSFIARENGFESEAKLMNYSVIETPLFAEDATAISGLGVSVPLVKWAFENGTGKSSDVFRVQSGWVVTMVSDVVKAGIKKFEDANPSIKITLSKNKKLDKAYSLIGEIKNKMGNDPSIAKSIWQFARVDSTTEFTIAGSIPGIGLEYAFSNYTINAPLNQWSDPIKGKIGAYLIDVTYRTKFDENQFNYQKADLKKEIIKNRKSQYLNVWLQNLKKESKIVDNRYLFYKY
jgi:peptidyl-prolyl cis-trans isomerase D